MQREQVGLFTWKNVPHQSSSGGWGWYTMLGLFLSIQKVPFDVSIEA